MQAQPMQPQMQPQPMQPQMQAQPMQPQMQAQPMQPQIQPANQPAPAWAQPPAPAPQATMEASAAPMQTPREVAAPEAAKAQEKEQKLDGDVDDILADFDALIGEMDNAGLGPGVQPTTTTVPK